MSLSNGQIGSGAVLKVGASSPPTVGEIVDFSVSGKSWGTVTTTSLQSLSDEFKKTLKKGGSVDITYNRYGLDTGQLAMAAAHESGVENEAFSIVLAKTSVQTTTGDTYAFTGLIEELDDISTVKAEGIILTKAKIKVQGGTATPWVFTAGS